MRVEFALVSRQSWLYRMVREILGLLLLNSLLCASGAGLLLLVGWSTLSELRRWVGLSYLVGVAWTGIAGGLLLVAGFSFDSVEIAAVAVLPLATFVFVSRLREKRARPAPEVDGSRWIAAPAILIAGLIVLKSAVQPLSAWDAWSFWIPKAKSLIYFDGLSSAFLQSGVANADYPPLLPILESAAFRFMGQFDTTLIHVQFAFLFVAFVSAVAEMSNRLPQPYKLGTVLVLIAASPAMYMQVSDAYADAPLAIFVSVAALLLWRGIRENKGAALPLAALFLAAAMATKVEGMIFAAAIAVTLLWVSRHDSGAWRRILGVVAAAAAVSVIPWRLWLLANDIHGTYHFRANYLLEQPDRFVHALTSLGGNLVTPARWLLLPVVVLAGIAIGLAGERRPEASFVLGTLVISILALDVTYWGTSYPFDWHLRTSADRVTTTPFLLAATFTPALITSISRPDRSRT